MKNKKSAYFLWIIFVLITLGSCSAEKNVQVKSPDGSFTFSIKVNVEDSDLQYGIDFQGAEIIGTSDLGFKFSENDLAVENLSIKEVVTHSMKTSWEPVYGERNNYPDIYNEAFIRFTSNPFALRIRAYNEGVAFRYEFLEEGESIHISEENTEFSLTENALAWISARAQSEITKTQISEIQETVERPILIQYSDSLFIAIGEAALVDYARMKLINKTSGSGILKSKLAGIVQHDGPFHTPWRFIMAANRPSQLLEHSFFLLNLNEPNKIENTSWIKPGKVIREVTLTTRGGMACVDFAVNHNLQFIEFDAGWYGPEYDDASDATTITVDPKRSKGPLDLMKVIDYAKSRDIGVILYINRRALEKQLDEVLPLLKSWGVRGLKYGFVNVGTQPWTNWLHDAVRKAADHELMVDVHDEYRPTGYSRTYPNFMTQEGIRGDEESPENSMVINTLFTRMIAGAGDHTNCYFASRVTKKMGSHVSQLAKTICIYSPWQFLYWYDRPQGSRPGDEGAGGSQEFIQEVPELSFFDNLPTIWDDTRVIDGYPGELAIIARKKEDKWYLGVLTGTKQHQLSLPLDFLEKEVRYKATIFSHDQSLESVTNVRIQEMEVMNQTVLEHQISAQNGLAAIFLPTK